VQAEENKHTNKTLNKKKNKNNMAEENSIQKYWGKRPKPKKLIC
jgi:hypothetical protein